MLREPSGLGIPDNNPPEPVQQSPEDLLLDLARDSLGFRESTQMQALRLEMGTLDQETEESKAKFIDRVTEYQTLASQEIDKIQNPDFFPRAQIGLIVASAAIYHSARRFQNYSESMDDATTYAEGMGFYDVAQNLKVRQQQISFIDSQKRGPTGPNKNT